MKARVIHLDPRAVAVDVVEDKLQVALADGRQLLVPLEWSPRLLRATPGQRCEVELIAKGRLLHWPAVDEDIDVKSLLGCDVLIVPPDEDLGLD